MGMLSVELPIAVYRLGRRFFSIKNSVLRQLMSRFLTLAFTSLFFIQSAKAVDQLTPQLVSTGGTQAQFISSAKWTANEMAHTMFFIAMVSSLSISINLWRQHHQSNTKPTWSELKAYSEVAFDEIFNRGEIWISSMSATLAKAGLIGSVELLSQYCDQLKKILSNESQRSLLKNLFSSTLSNLIIFVGWEFGKNWWQEAVMLLPLEDRMSAKQLVGKQQSLLLWDDVKLNSEDINFDALSLSRSRDGVTILGKIMGNMFRILFFNSELRNQMLHNTWRLSLATGDFVSLVGLSSAGSVVGAKLLRTAPGFGGLAGGVVGLLAYSLIPATFFQKMTLEIKKWRADVDQYFVEFHQIINACHDQNGAVEQICLKDSFLKLATLREHHLIPLFEALLLFENHRLQMEQSDLSTIKEKKENLELRDEVAKDILNFYKKHTKRLEDLLPFQKNKLIWQEELAKNYKIFSVLESKLRLFLDINGQKDLINNAFFINLVYKESYEAELISLETR